MYERIKQLADEAIALQNKQVMDVTLRDISAICATAMSMSAEQFEADALATHREVRANPAVMESAAKLKEVVAPAAKKGTKK
jgi:hypothetical protein